MMNQRGNILFLILLAVILFAALSYAVTSSMRGGGTGASAEKLQTTAAEIINYSTLVEETVARLRLTNGCKDTEISFLYDFDGDGVVENTSDDRYYNPNAPLDKRCNVFDPAGGNLSLPPPPLRAEYQQASGWINNGTVNNWQTVFGGRQIFITGNAVATDAQDLILVVPFVSKDLCDVLNRKLNGQDTFQYSNQYWYIYTFRGGYDSPQSQSTAVPYNTGCVYKNSDSFYLYFNVLVAR